MQLKGATPLEKELYDLCHIVEIECEASEFYTRLSIALSNASDQLQRTRGFWPPLDPELGLTHGMNCPALIPNSDDECVCGLRWRIAMRTEQEIGSAWRKRAEEAESKLLDMEHVNS